MARGRKGAFASLAVLGACAVSVVACASGDDSSVIEAPDSHLAGDSGHGGNDAPIDVPSADSTTDSTTDARSDGTADSHVDSHPDAVTDSGALDSAPDAEIDSTLDAGVDSDLDTGIDSAVDVVAVDAPAPLAGDVVISEVLIDAPTVGTTSEVGEYVELFNASSHTVNLAGCVLRSKSGTSTESTAAFGDVAIAPLEYVVLQKATAGATYDYAAAATYGTITFSNSTADYVALQCAAGDVDGVGWNADTDFPDVTAKPTADTSRERSTASLALGKDTTSTTWCDGTASHTITNATGTGTFKGSPAAANGCP